MSALALAAPDVRRAGAGRGGAIGPVAQAQLPVRAPDDAFEREAERFAAAVGGLVPGRLDELPQGVGGVALQRRAGTVAPPAPDVDRAVDAARGSGRPLDGGARREFEAKLGHDFGRVRLHADERAAQAAEALGANAFTVGDDIVFGRGRYAPGTDSGRRLLAHELVHVAQQRAAGPVPRSVQRQEAAAAAVAPPALAPAQLAAAVAYNRFRFKDPYTVRLIRETLGMESFPAVADEAFANAIAQWQEAEGLTVDGQAGPATTASLVAAMQAAGQSPSDVTQLQVDNFVTTTNVTPPTFNTDTGAPIQHFVWEVGFRTSLRNGFIVQQIDNEFVPAMCDGTPYTGWQPIPRYWEAWSVDGAGQVTPNLGAVNDQWTRPFRPRSHGRWSMRGRTFTTLSLPTSFDVGGAADAGSILRSTTADPGGDFLGLKAGDRQIGGTWDFCPPSNTHVRA